LSSFRHFFLAAQTTSEFFFYSEFLLRNFSMFRSPPSMRSRFGPRPFVFFFFFDSPLWRAFPIFFFPACAVILLQSVFFPPLPWSAFCIVCRITCFSCLVTFFWTYSSPISCVSGLFPPLLLGTGMWRLCSIRKLLFFTAFPSGGRAHFL